MQGETEFRAGLRRVLDNGGRDRPAALSLTACGHHEADAMAAKSAENPGDGNVIAFPGVAPTADEPLTERAVRHYPQDDAEPSGALRDLVEGRWPS